MKRILIVEDETAIREFEAINLKRVGYDITEAGSGEEALEIYDNDFEGFDIALLDISMPGMDGFTLCKELRKRSQTLGIIMLTARTQEMDKISGLMLGADDYITKPFNPLELVARVKSQIRRYTQLGNLGQQNNSQVYKCGGLMINDDTKDVTVDGDPIKLTPIEFEILYLLASNPGRVFSTDEIFEKVWNEKVYEANNTVMVHIRRLRGKMKEDSRQNKIITTVWGVGYKIEK